MLNRDNLHAYQDRAVDFIKDKQTVALFLDMGLGKTVSTLTAVSDLLDDYAVMKVLIIAPLRVANSVWHKEALEWEHLKHLKFSLITGTAKQKETALYDKKAEIFVTNRESIPWLIDKIGKKKGAWDFDMLVFDESSSFKNSKSLRFRKIKTKLRETEYRVLLTGTPSPNGYMDLWSQFYLLDGGGRLGFNLSQYRNAYFTSDFMGYKYTVKPNAPETIQNRLKDITLSMGAEDYLELPDKITSVLDTPLPPNLMKEYRKFEKQMIMELGDEEITAMSAAALSNKLLQFASGAIYDENKSVHKIHELKFDTLDEIIEENPNDNLLIAYNYKHELDRLMVRYPDAVVMDKEGKAVDRWNNGEIKMLLAHPASAGHGLNLQHGGSLAVWFGFNWSLELYQQFNARLYRQGQTDVVRIMHIAVGEIEHRLMRTLAQKNVTQTDLLKALK